MKERLIKLAPITVPLVLFAAACKSDGSEKNPPKFEDGIKIQTTLVPQELQPTVAVITPQAVKAQEIQQTDKNLHIVELTDEDQIEVTQELGSIVYKYKIYSRDSLDTLLNGSFLILEKRLSSGAFQSARSLIQSGIDNPDHKDPKVVDKINEAAKLIADDCSVRPDPTNSMHSYMKRLGSYVFNNGREVFLENSQIYLNGGCFWGEKYEKVPVKDSNTKAQTLEQVTDEPKYTKTLDGDAIVLYSDMSYEQLLSEENLTNLGNIYAQKDFLYLRTYIKSAQYLDSENPQNKDIRQYLKQAAAILETNCTTNETARDNMIKLLSLVDQKYPESLEDFASFAQICNITSNPA